MKYRDCMLLSATFVEPKGRHRLFEPKGVLIDGDIYNSAGNLAVHIEKNEIHLTSGEYAYPRFSENFSTLDVIDKQGKLLLHVHYANVATIEIQGEFRCHNSPPITVTDEGIERPDEKPEVGNCSINSCKQAHDCAPFIFH